MIEKFFFVRLTTSSCKGLYRDSKYSFFFALISHKSNGFFVSLHQIEWWMKFFSDKGQLFFVGFVFLATIISVVSLLYSSKLARNLAAEERMKIEIWASAIEQLATADEAADMALILKVLENNKTIPIILYDENGWLHWVAFDKDNVEKFGVQVTGFNPALTEGKMAAWLNVTIRKRAVPSAYLNVVGRDEYIVFVKI